MVGVIEIPTSTATQPVGSTQPIGTNPFGSLFSTPGCNSQSIPSISSPFSFVMPNTMSKISSSIQTTNANPSFGPGGKSPPYAPLSFGGSHITQTNPTVGGWPHFCFGPNPSLNAPGWSAQLGGQVTSSIPSFTPSSSMLIMINTVIIANPPLSSRFLYGGSQFHTMGNPHPRAPSTGGNVYNPHYDVSASMVPIQPFMN
jgi:hypothetical protein